MDDAKIRVMLAGMKEKTVRATSQRSKKTNINLIVKCTYYGYFARQNNKKRNCAPNEEDNTAVTSFSLDCFRFYLY